MPTTESTHHSTMPGIITIDVAQAIDLVQRQDTAKNRRDLVRSAFAAIEGLLTHMKEAIIVRLKYEPKLVSAHEMAALQDETYSVNDRGMVNIQPKFIPLLTSVRLVVNIAKRYLKDYEVDFSHRGWESLQSALLVRHRLVHPKEHHDMAVSDAEKDDVIRGVHWMMALAIELSFLTLKQIETFGKTMEKQADDLKKKLETEVGNWTPPEN